MNTAVSSSVKAEANQAGAKKLGVRNVSKEPVDLVVRLSHPARTPSKQLIDVLYFALPNQITIYEERCDKKKKTIRTLL